MRRVMYTAITSMEVITGTVRVKNDYSLVDTEWLIGYKIAKENSAHMDVHTICIHDYFPDKGVYAYRLCVNGCNQSSGINYIDIDYEASDGVIRWDCY